MTNDGWGNPFSGDWKTTGLGVDAFGKPRGPGGASSSENKLPTDGWGSGWKAPDNQTVNKPAVTDGWVQTAHDEWQRTVEPGTVITNEVVTGWGVPLSPNWSIQAEDAGDSWAKHPDQTSPMTVGPEAFGDPANDTDYYDQVKGIDAYADREAATPKHDAWSKFVDAGRVPAPSEMTKADIDKVSNWTAARVNEANERASVLNSLSGKRDEWVMETDGELNKREEVIPTVTPNVPTGFYIAYHTGKWLHAVLSGPYPDKGAAIVMADAAYARMTEDSVFKLAFENKFERNGIYIAEIPMSARRHGAYGVLA